MRSDVDEIVALVEWGAVELLWAKRPAQLASDRGLTALVYQRHQFRAVAFDSFRASAEYALGSGDENASEQKRRYLLGTFAGVYVLVLTVFSIFFAAWSSEPQLPPSSGKETCAPYRDGNRSTGSCLA